jgi:hypothetical protein
MHHRTFNRLLNSEFSKQGSTTSVVDHNIGCLRLERSQGMQPGSCARTALNGVEEHDSATAYHVYTHVPVL